jgi:hypothetical protein
MTDHIIIGLALGGGVLTAMLNCWAMARQVRRSQAALACLREGEARIAALAAEVLGRLQP